MALGEYADTGKNTVSTLTPSVVSYGASNNCSASVFVFSGALGNGRALAALAPQGQCNIGSSRVGT